MSCRDPCVVIFQVNALLMLFVENLPIPQRPTILSNFWFRHSSIRKIVRLTSYSAVNTNSGYC